MDNLVFPLLEFSDRTGTIRTVAGCSLLGRDELWARLAAIREILAAADPETEIADLWDSTPMLRHHICKCLELNGIEPDWVTLPMAVELLLHPGHLIAFNQPPAPRYKGSGNGAKIDSTEGMIAAVATHCGLSEALVLAETVPARRLLRVIEEKYHIESYDREKEEAKALKDKAMGKIEELRERFANG
jgi:hypothetical protein